MEYQISMKFSTTTIDFSESRRTRLELKDKSENFNVEYKGQNVLSIKLIINEKIVFDYFV